MSKTEMFRFETANFIVRATIEEDCDVDTSFDETGETAEKIDDGEWQAFHTTVTVTTKSGVLLGRDDLGGSIYGKPADFFTAHRDPNAMNRNSSIMRATKGNVVICHYFPSMVSEAVAAARKTMANMPKLRIV